MGSSPAPDDLEPPLLHPPPPHPHWLPQPSRSHPHRRRRETVINGTTWYLPPPPPPTHHHPHPFPLPPFPPDSRHPPPAPRSFPYFDGRIASQDYSYPHYYHPQDGSYDLAYMNDGAHGSSYCATGYGGTHGYGGYEGGGGVRGNVHAYCYDVIPYNATAGAHGSNDYDRRACAQGYEVGFMSNPWYGAPPHPVPTHGRTAYHLVSWCGLTMPVTITNQAAAIIEWVHRRTGDLFGLDLEWRPNRTRGEDNKAALLQLCGPNDCLIIQLLYTDMIPNSLVDFLLDSTKCLGGVGIKQDVNKLERDHGLSCKGQVELGALASEKMRRQDLHTTGLKKLVDEVLGRTLVKKKKITLSDWEKEYLDERQIEYACIDAWAALAIMQKLMAL